MLCLTHLHGLGDISVNCQQRLGDIDVLGMRREKQNSLSQYIKKPWRRKREMGLGQITKGLGCS